MNWTPSSQIWLILDWITMEKPFIFTHFLNQKSPKLLPDIMVESYGGLPIQDFQVSKYPRIQVSDH